MVCHVQNSKTNDNNNRTKQGPGRAVKISKEMERRVGGREIRERLMSPSELSSQAAVSLRQNQCWSHPVTSALRKEKLQNMTPGLRVWLGARALTPML